jgi:hypothetical protein
MAINPNNIEQIGTDIYADSPKTDSSDFGAIHKMSRDGKTIIASKLLSPYRNSNNFDDDGRVIIYELSNDEWVLTGYFDGNHRDDSQATPLDAKLGAYVDISDDGNRAVAFASAAPIMDNIADTNTTNFFTDFQSNSNVSADIEGADYSPGTSRLHGAIHVIDNTYFNGADGVVYDQNPRLADYTDEDGIFNWISNGQYNFNGYIEIYDKSGSTWSSSQKIYIEDVFQNRISTTSPESIGLEIRSLCLSGDGNTLAFIANYWSGNPEPISPQDDGLYKNFEIHIWKKSNGSFSSHKVLQSDKAGLADITSAFLDSSVIDAEVNSPSTIGEEVTLSSNWTNESFALAIDQMQTAFDFDDVNYTDQLNLNYDGSSFILGMPNGPGFIAVETIGFDIPNQYFVHPYYNAFYMRGLGVSKNIGVPGRWGEVHIYKDDGLNNWNRTGAFFGSQNNSEAGSTTAINKNGDVIAFGNAPNFGHFEDVFGEHALYYGNYDLGVSADAYGYVPNLDPYFDQRFYSPSGSRVINTEADTTVRIFKWDNTLQKWIIRDVLTWPNLVMPNDPGGFNRLAASVSSIDMNDSGNRVVIGLSTNNDLVSDTDGLSAGESGDVVLLYDWNNSTNQYDLKHTFRPASAEAFESDICAFGHQVYLSGDGKTLSIANPMVATDLRDSTQEFGMLGPGYWGGLGDNSSDGYYGHIEVYTLGKDSFSRLGETETIWYLGSSAVTAAYLGDTKLL